MDIYWGLGDCGEGDRDADINWLAPGNLWKYITVPASVIDFPGTECGILFILIVDLILRSDLLEFSLLRASNYYYKQEQFIVENITIFTIQEDYSVLPCYRDCYQKCPKCSIIYITTMLFLLLSYFILKSLCFLCILCHNFWGSQIISQLLFIYILIYRTNLHFLFVGHQVRKTHDNVYQK